MKKIITLTESDLTRIVKRIVKEQNEKKLIDYVLKPSLTLDKLEDNLKKENSEVIKSNQRFLNKKYNLNLPVDGKVSEEYTKALNLHLEFLKISRETIKIMGIASNFLPVYETYLDLKTLVNGIISGDNEQLFGGIASLSSASISYKAIVNLLDYFAEKTVGETKANNMANARKDVLNMSDYELELLYKNYGWGGYDKWVKDGKPELK
jgi:hypothetical protein